MITARVAPWIVLAVVVLLGIATARAVARRTTRPGRAPDARAEAVEGRVLRFLAGAFLCGATGVLVLRDALASHGLASGALAAPARGGLVLAGAAAVVLLALSLNALARPRGITPGWTLVLAAPFTYLLALGALPWLLRGAQAPAVWVDLGVPVVAGVVTGGFLFLTTLTGAGADDNRTLAGVVGVAVAASAQGMAATVIVTGADALDAWWVLAADVGTLIAVLLVVAWVIGGDAPRTREHVVTLTPGDG